MNGVLQCAYKAAQVSDTTMLLQGETGTGKQILARAIHALDQKRRHYAFVTVHCSTISESLAESELFGHRKGSFSGADAARSGLFQAANRGTLFLDDINDLPLRLQPKLLDALQRGIIRSLGSDRETPIDVRVIAAANHSARVGDTVDKSRRRFRSKRIITKLATQVRAPTHRIARRAHPAGVLVAC